MIRSAVWPVSSDVLVDTPRIRTPFSEFLWADFLRRRIKRQDVEKDFDGALEEALKLAKGMDSDYLPGWCGPVTDD